MKNLFLISFLFIYLFSYGQEKNETFGDKYFFNEFNVSVNRTSFYDRNAQQQLRFGTGVNRIWGEKKKINLVLGFEYNLTRLFINDLYETHFSNLQNIQYTTQFLSFPLSLRRIFGNKTNFFVDLGLYFEVGKTLRTGARHSYVPYQQNQTWMVDNEVNSFRERSGYQNYGVLCGFGVKIPAKKNEFIIKADYKLGLLPLFAYYDIIPNCYLRLSLGYKIW